ncbi:MAG: GFA family protein [Pararheinheimera sp.]|nr:GFA family protein [Rheinheimera sp.]
MSASQVQTPGAIHGHCLCGKVNIKATGVALSAGACHCQYCRRWSGGPLFTLDCGTEVKLDGACFISAFHSSEWAERGFCNNCGTHLFYRLKQNGRYFIPVGLFGPLKDLVFDHQIFIEQKPDWYCFANKTSELTGDEIFALFAEESN